eukprot:SAG22_NODE_1182_length_5233_cov_12.254188_5_plen_90_part_00
MRDSKPLPVFPRASARIVRSKTVSFLSLPSTCLSVLAARLVKDANTQVQQLATQFSDFTSKMQANKDRCVLQLWAVPPLLRSLLFACSC